MPESAALTIPSQFGGIALVNTNIAWHDLSLVMHAFRRRKWLCTLHCSCCWFPRELILRAKQAFDNYLRLQGQGRFVEAANELTRLREALQQLGEQIE